VVGGKKRRGEKKRSVRERERRKKKDFKMELVFFRDTRFDVHSIVG
jgi:hypothetical protein